MNSSWKRENQPIWPANGWSPLELVEMDDPETAAKLADLQKSF